MRSSSLSFTASCNFTLLLQYLTYYPIGPTTPTPAARPWTTLPWWRLIKQADTARGPSIRFPLCLKRPMRTLSGCCTPCAWSAGWTMQYKTLNMPSGCSTMSVAPNTNIWFWECSCVLFFYDWIQSVQPWTTPLPRPRNRAAMASAEISTPTASLGSRENHTRPRDLPSGHGAYLSTSKTRKDYVNTRVPMRLNLGGGDEIGQSTKTLMFLFFLCR